MLKKQKRLRLTAMEQDAMRHAGQVNAALLDFVRPHIRPGITTQSIDDLVVQFTSEHGHVAACLNYGSYPNLFPRSCCTSVNEVICHGIPGDYVLKEGDIVNVDVTTIVDGWHGDQSETFLIGDCSDAAKAVTQCAFDCLYLGIEAIEPGGRVADIGTAIVEEAHGRGFSVVREFVGHGLGRKFHQDPSIPHFPNRQSHQEIITPGICFTIEPMINEGTRHAVIDSKDNWTVRTRDGKLSAQFEHTILMTEDGPEILTLTKDGPQRGHKF